MFGIGAFARLGQVSPRTLRYYDDEGLLPPATVDIRTGYRWYGRRQAVVARRTRVLRGLDLSVADTRRVLDAWEADWPTAAAVLTAHRDRLSSQVARAHSASCPIQR